MKPPLHAGEAFFIMSYILTEIKDRIGYVILNRPDKRNALNAEFVSELKQSIQTFEDNAGVRAIIIKSSGKVFCAGADLAYLQQLQSNTYEENLQDSENLAHLFKQIYICSKPIISMVNGPALAGGCGLATVCDICFATPSSTFGYTESRIGFIPAIVFVFLRKKIAETHVKKLLFTGEIISASHALSLGLISEITEASDFEKYVHQWTVNLIENSSGNSLSSLKQMYNSIDGLTLEESLKYACEMNAKTRESSDCKSGIAAFLNKQIIKW